MLPPTSSHAPGPRRYRLPIVTAPSALKLVQVFLLARLLLALLTPDVPEFPRPGLSAALEGHADPQPVIIRSVRVRDGIQRMLDTGILSAVLLEPAVRRGGCSRGSWRKRSTSQAGAGARPISSGLQPGSRT